MPFVLYHSDANKVQSVEMGEGAFSLKRQPFKSLYNRPLQTRYLSRSGSVVDTEEPVFRLGDQGDPGLSHGV